MYHYYFLHKKKIKLRNFNKLKIPSDFSKSRSCKK